MNKYFDSEKNPIVGIFLSYMLTEDEDLLDDENILYLYAEINDYLEMVLKNKEHANYLNFDIKSDKKVDYVEIKPKNLITALWFCGIFPDNCERVEDNGTYIHIGKQYSLNKRTKKLKIVEK